MKLEVVIDSYETQISEREQKIDILSPGSSDIIHVENTSTTSQPPSMQPMPNTWSYLESHVSYEKSHTVCVALP